MRTCKIISAAIVAALLLAIPMIAVSDAADASVDEKSSSVYFDSKGGLSAEEIGRFITIDMSSSSVQTILESTGDFNLGAYGFSISEISTSNYHVEGGIARSISDSESLSYGYRIVSMDIEFKLTAKENSSALFRGNFNGDALYGFTKSVSVKQNDVMTFKGTLSTEYTTIDEKHLISGDGKYFVTESKVESSERTVLALDAAYKSSDGKEQTFRFDSSFKGYGTQTNSQDADPDNIKNLAIGDTIVSEEDYRVTGKGNVIMGYEGNEYSAVSQLDSYQTVYRGIRSTNGYSGEQTCTIYSTMLMTEDQYKSSYVAVEPKEFLNAFTGTDQELFEQIGSVGIMDLDDFDKVKDNSYRVTDDIIGKEQKDTTLQIAMLIILVLVGLIVILVAAVIVTNRRKKRW